MSPWNPWFTLAIAILGTWRVAHLIAREDGPFDVILRARAWLGHNVLGRLMDCPHCLNLWIAIPFAFLLETTMPRWAAAWLAIAGGASLLECLTSRDSGATPGITSP
jgi:hypothetical protein